MTPPGRVALGYFSLSGHAASGDDRPYLGWHALDHMPEQYQLPGMVLGQRWAATPACRAARMAAGEGWADVEHVVCYLMGDPLDDTLDGFLALGRRLAERGRFPLHLPSHFRGGLRLVGAHAAPRVLVGAEVVPFRPHLGVYLVVEEAGDGTRTDCGSGTDIGSGEDAGAGGPVASLLSVDGVAGVWVFATTPAVRRDNFSPGDRRVTLCYLDEDPATVAGRLAPALQASWTGSGSRPLLAAPYESLVRWDWDRFAPELHA